MPTHNTKPKSRLSVATKHIILDVDGVLNSLQSTTDNDLNSYAMNGLLYLIRKLEQPVIHLYSAWPLADFKRRVEALFGPNDYIEITSIIQDQLLVTKTRGGLEVLKYLQINNIPLEDTVIIDDSVDIQWDRGIIVRPNYKIGLTKSDVRRAMNRLGVQ